MLDPFALYSTCVLKYSTVESLVRTSSFLLFSSQQLLRMIHVNILNTTPQNVTSWAGLMISTKLDILLPMWLVYHSSPSSSTQTIFCSKSTAGASRFGSGFILTVLRNDRNWKRYNRWNSSVLVDRDSLMIVIISWLSKKNMRKPTLLKFPTTMIS